MTNDTPVTASVGEAPGHAARSPWAIPAKGWKAILLRTWREAGEDNIGLIAAGVAFYAFLSIVPLLGAIVLIYGIVADPATVSANVAALTGVMPKQVAAMIGEQLLQVVTTSKDAKGFGLLIALALALYGAMRGAEAVVTALNIAYEEHEDRGFVKQKLLALAVTLGAVIVALAAILSVAMMAFLDSLIPGAPPAVLLLTRLLSYLILAGLGAAGAATLYRYGPSRAHARWVWLTPGSVGATLIWIAMTVGFGFYVANFGSYDATYGSLGAIVVMLTWLSLSAYVFLLGAELNSELERQTDADTTTGPDRAPGERGAAMANVGAAPPAAIPPVWIGVAGLAVMRAGRPIGVALIATAIAMRWRGKR
jgi:membrane protein